MDPLLTGAAATPPDAAALELAPVLALAVALPAVTLPGVKVPVGSVGWISVVVVVSALRLPTAEEGGEEEVKVLMGPPGVADVRAVTDAAADGEEVPVRIVTALSRLSVGANMVEGVSMGAETASSARAAAVVVVVARARERRMAGSMVGGVLLV